MLVGHNKLVRTSLFLMSFKIFQGL